MFIVKHRESGKYFKRGNYSSWFDAKLVEKKLATIYRSKAGAIKSVGRWKPLETLRRNKQGVVVAFGEYVLDETTWEIVTVEIK